MGADRCVFEGFHSSPKIRPFHVDKVGNKAVKHCRVNDFLSCLKSRHGGFAITLTLMGPNKPRPGQCSQGHLSPDKTSIPSDRRLSCGQPWDVVGKPLPKNVFYRLPKKAAKKALFRIERSAMVDLSLSASCDYSIHKRWRQRCG